MFTQCIEVQEWIEEEISKPIEEWVEKTEEKCKKRPWYDPRRWLCWLVTTLVKVVTWVLVKVGKWFVRTICKLTYAVVKLIDGVLSGIWSIIVGIVTLDWNRVLDGLIELGISIINSSFNLISVIFGGDTIDYILGEYDRDQLKDHVRKLLEAKYTGDELQSIKNALHLNHGAFGYRIKMQAIRTYIDSETLAQYSEIPNLVSLHEKGKINLRELCGFEFNEGFWNRKRYKTLKKGTVITGGGGVGEFENPITLEELELYLSSRGKQGPKFIVLSMSDAALNVKLDAAKLKARELGLISQWNNQLVEVIKVEHIKQMDDDEALQDFLQNVIGRNNQFTNREGALAELCKPVVIGIFAYSNTKRRGLSACLKGSICQLSHRVSGATFIDNTPDLIRKYVPIHELGHYFGLCHVDGLDRVMFSSEKNSPASWGILFKLLYRKNAPSFTLDEAKQAWNYIVEHFPAACLGGNKVDPVIE